MKVFVTDAASSFGQVLLPALCAHSTVQVVTALDTRVLEFNHPKLNAVRIDCRDAAVTPMLTGHDALVHLGAPPPAAGLGTLETKVQPVHRLFQAADSAGVQRLIHVSTAAVYGAAIHANEQSPLKPLPDFPYAAEQAHLEQILEIDFPRCVRLRPHLIVGRNAHPAVRRLIRQPFYPRVPEPQPLFQCLHEDDLASAVLVCLTPAARGAYNLATEESFSLREAVRIRCGVSIGLTPGAARCVIGVAGRLSRHHIDPAWLERVSHTLTVNCRRAVVELGWQRRYTARQALVAT